MSETRIHWYPGEEAGVYTSNKGVTVHFTSTQTMITNGNDTVLVDGRITFAECRAFFADLGVVL